MYTVTIYVMSWMSIIFQDMLYFKIYVNVYSNYLCYVVDEYNIQGYALFQDICKCIQ